MNLLIFCPSPRDIPEFIEAIKKINHDKFIIKYLGYEDNPYPQARKFFLKHTEYTHFAICPDDLIVTPEGVEQLVKDAENMDFIAGMCNVDLTDLDMLAMTYNLPSRKRIGRTFVWYRKDDLKYKEQKIIPVGWCGTPFAIFSRKIMEQLEFLGDARWNEGASRTESFDIGIATDLKEMGISEMVDTRVFFRHMRYGGAIQVDYKKPYIIWVHDGKKEILKPKFRNKLKSVFDHPLYKQHDPLQRPDIFLKAGLPVERPPPIEKKPYEKDR